MKRIILILLSSVLLIVLFAEDTVRIFKSDKSMVTMLVSAIDSITFGNGQNQMDIHKTDKTISSQLIASVDSLSFSKEEYDTLSLDFFPEIQLNVSTSEWNKLLTYFDQNPQNEEYIVSGFQIKQSNEYTQLDSIGIRLRGNTSRRRPEGSTAQLHNAVSPDWHHSHFALSFSKNRKKQRYAGVEKINLKWFKDDADYVRELYCYDLFHRFGVWTAPKASYCRLKIAVNEDNKPAYFGVYGLMESIDEDYIAKRTDHWGTTPGFLWKCTYLADFVGKTSIGIEEVYLDASLSKSFAFDLKTRKKELTTAKTQLTTFIDSLNIKTGLEFEKWVDKSVDVDLLLRAYAVNVMVGMWDDYWVNGNNYYVYFAANGKAYFIPYDYDNTLGTSAIVSNSGTQDLLKWGNMSSRPLITKILAIPRYQAAYKAYIRELADPANNYFDANRSLERIQRWQNRIQQYVWNDTGEDMLIEDKPAAWGNCSFYRLKSGNDAGGASGNANYFKTKVKSIGW